VVQIPVLAGIFATTAPDLRTSYPIGVDTRRRNAYSERMAHKHRTADIGLLLEYLEYCPDTGRLLWRERARERFSTLRGYATWNSRYAGKEAGTPFTGYISISIHKNRILAHRIAWAMYFGEWPEADIDHINGDRRDNRIKNLRSVSRGENRKNSAMHSRNTSGVSGVDWFKPAQLWRARIHDDGKEITLGYFKDMDSAVAARKAAEPKYGYHPNHGRR
jgi:hypothetical protein